MKDRQDDEDVLKDVGQRPSARRYGLCFRERLRSIASVTERRTLGGLARELGKLPVEVARAALETSAALAGVSLRASVEFFRYYVPNDQGHEVAIATRMAERQAARTEKPKRKQRPSPPMASMSDALRPAEASRKKLAETQKKDAAG